MLLAGKRALVVGLLNKHSLAASVTQALLRHGASCVVASRNPLTESQLKACAFEIPALPSSSGRAPTLHMASCDVERDDSIDALIGECSRVFNGELDILVHSVAFAPRETFQPQGTLQASRTAWQQAMDVSAYSLIALSRAAHPLLEKAAIRIGDLIEFAASRDVEPANGLTVARVMDVDPSAPHECIVQISPFDPFQKVDLTRAFYKIVYAVGEMAQLTTTMIGWEIEIVADAERNTMERGVIKQVDSDLNCALLAFQDGHKDWRDLTMNQFKVIGRITKATSASPPKVSTLTKPEASAPLAVPKLRITSDATRGDVQTTSTTLPTSAVDGFDWYAEGGHIELCTAEGHFREGALLCSQREQCLQLYNETRQFFEIEPRKQSFKVVIHGLLSLKTIPLGQKVDVYSPMHGAFRAGAVMKEADVGKLTPVRFDDDGSVEWLDLSSQTFKLLFLVASVEIP
ncbi:hypothetical protein ATCC90586_000814 [Pythium insidiosum]|nr:hypothetical protein ATCC90586_000814 [Pythium insidiosum]